MDQETMYISPKVSTPRSRCSPDDRPIVTLGAATAASPSYEPVDSEVQFRRSSVNPNRPDFVDPLHRDNVPNMAGMALPRAPIDHDGVPRVAPPGAPGMTPFNPSMMGCRPEPYDGETDWFEYAVMFDQYAECMGWDQRTKAAMLGFCLRGPARSVFVSLPAELRTDYEALRNALGQNFSPREQVHLFQAELKSRQRKQGESLTTLGRDIARLVRYAYPTADNNTREIIGVNAFLDALPGSALEIRLHVAKGKPDTLQQAMALAMEVDAVLEAEARRGSVPRRGAMKSAKGEQESLVEQLRAELTGMMKDWQSKMEQTVKKNQTPRKEIVCFRCKKKGHMKRDCRVPEDKLPRQGNGQGQQPRDQ